MASEQPIERPRSPQRPPVAFVPESSVMKLTRGHSCVLCQQRKVRCDKQKPCANCVKANIECRVIPPQPPRRRKKKPQERDLIERLKKYESLLSQHGVNFEPIGYDLKATDHADDVTDLENDLVGLKTSPSSGADGAEGQEKQKWFPYYREYRHTNEKIQDSSDDEYEGPTIHHAFDRQYENNDGFPFMVGGANSSVTHLHPSAIQIIQLWQIYISNVNPLLKITHAPTVQAEIIAASANMSKISKPLEALMFSIYFAAVNSMYEAETHTMFGEDKAVLQKKYHDATQQALINAGFMRSSDMVVLQALFLYLLCVRQYVDPRALFCLLGVATRLANRIGVHLDGAQFGLSPFETEQRRRLWWQIVSLDKRIAEITGSAITALSSSNGDCKLPLNVNDADLSVHTKDPPPPHTGPTEMIFALARAELMVVGAPNGIQQGPSPGKAGTPTNKPRVQYSPSPSTPDVVTHIVNSQMPTDLEAFCSYMEHTYLSHCDPNFPLHLFTLLMTRQYLCKLRVVTCLSRGGSAETTEAAERDAIFHEAVRMIEYDNEMQSSEILRNYRWYTQLHFPFPAYIFLSSDLRTRTTGELCQRAWTAMEDNYHLRGMARLPTSPMHVAIGHTLLKCWEARETAEAQLSHHVPVPKMITTMRNIIMRFPPDQGENGPMRGGFGMVDHMRGGPPPGGGGGGGGGGMATASTAGSSASPPTVTAPHTAPTMATSGGTADPRTESIGRGNNGMYSGGKPMQGANHVPGAAQVSGPPGTDRHNNNHSSSNTNTSHGGVNNGGNSHSNSSSNAMPVIMDDVVSYPAFDGTLQMFGSSLTDVVDFSQMDWNDLMQYGQYGGLSAATGHGGGMMMPQPQHPQAPPSAHHPVGRRR